MTAPDSRDGTQDPTDTDEPAEVDTDQDASQDDAPALREDGKPFTARDLANLRETLTKARRDARAAKRAAAPAPEGPAPEDLEAARRDVERYRTVGIRQAARAAFAEAGLDPKAANRAFRLLDLDDLTVNDDGDVDGLAEQVGEIREEFPALFASRAAPERRRPKVDAGRNGEPSAPRQTAAAKLAEQLLGGS